MCRAIGHVTSETEKDRQSEKEARVREDLRACVEALGTTDATSPRLIKSLTCLKIDKLRRC